MKLCANLNWLFQELPLLERFKAASEAGFHGVEILDPYGLNVQETVNALSLNALKMVLINCPPPNYTGGEPGWAAVPGSRFENDFRRGHRYAKALGAEHIHIMAGKAEGEEARATLVANLKSAAKAAPKQKLTVEPLNQDDQPGYFLSDFYLAKEIVLEVDAPNLRLQFDTYHAERIHGDVLSTWDAVKDMVSHVQVGQAPDRCEPTKLSKFFDRLKEDDYRNWVSAEYRPITSTNSSLSWLQYLKN